MRLDNLTPEQLNFMYDNGNAVAKSAAIAELSARQMSYELSKTQSITN